MNTQEIRNEMLERIPELRNIKTNPNNDPEIEAHNYEIFKRIEEEIDKFFSEIVDSLFEFVQDCSSN